jgi:hypothetical protein
MSDVDIAKLKPGDEVLVRMKVAARDGMGDRVWAHTEGDGLFITAEDIHSVLPRPIQVGDRVSARGTLLGSVVATHKDRAWVDNDRYGPATYVLSDLERVDD